MFHINGIGFVFMHVLLGRASSENSLAVVTSDWQPQCLGSCCLLLHLLLKHTPLGMDLGMVNCSLFS